MRLPARFAGVRLTARGFAFLAVALVGLVVAYASGWPALLAAALFLAAAVVAAATFVLVAPPDVVLERRIDPPLVEQGSPVRVRLTVRGAAGGSVEWAERTPSAAATRGTTSGILPGDGPRLVEYELTGRRRGALQVGPLTVVRADPLGLAAIRRAVGSTDTVVVLPRLHDVVVPSVVTRTDPDSAASTAFGPVGDQRDIVAREYRPGDPMRSVDWRATAHRGELMVRTEAAAAASSTAIGLESRTDAWRDDAEFEWAVEYAASIAAVLGERRTVVRLATDRRAGIATDVTGVLTGLAVVTRTTTAPRCPELAARLGAQDVRVVHLVTGSGSAPDLVRLPPLPHGTTGLVTLVSGADRRGAATPSAGWHLEVRDPAVPLGGRDA